ncbi:MAG TPA: transposase, partial [Verrucomicrobiae bacterium]|nr:transposase [Verrucomicrobiae bacterium]
MEQKNVVSLEKQVEVSSRSALDELLRQGAQRMLQSAIEAEVHTYVEECQGSVSQNGRRLVVRNGRLPERPLQTGLGPVRIEQPRVNDQRAGHKFTSRILPPYLRRVPSLDALIPALYLHGISTGDFT